MVTSTGALGSAKRLSPHRPKSALALATYLPIGMLQDMAVSVNLGSFCGCPYTKSPADFWKLPYLVHFSRPFWGLAWLGLAWLGLAWLGLAWLGLAWLGLAWLGLA